MSLELRHWTIDTILTVYLKCVFQTPKTISSIWYLSEELSEFAGEAKCIFEESSLKLSLDIVLRDMLLNERWPLVTYLKNMFVTHNHDTTWISPVSVSLKQALLFDCLQIPILSFVHWEMYIYNDNRNSFLKHSYGFNLSYTSENVLLDLSII